MPSSDKHPLGRRALWSWCLFDWANSGYPTIVVTFITATYVARQVAPSIEEGTAAWGTTMSASALLVALLAPFFGAIADRSGRRKSWLGVLSGLTIITGLLLWFVEPDESFLFLALFLAFAGSATFELGTVFYNAMLPEVAGRDRIGRVSGWAWGLGYAGGLVALGLCLVVFVMPETPPFGLDKAMAEEVRITAPLVSIWFLLFGLPLFFFVPERAPSGPSGLSAMRAGLTDLVNNLKRLPQRPAITRFLLARMFYTDGLNTLFAFGGIYAAGTLGLTFEEILIFAILMNVTSGIGALVFGWVDDWFGSKPTIVVSLMVLIVVGVAILLVESKTFFYVFSVISGIFIGPVQSASRSLMAHMAPPEERTEMFGLYALAGRATAFLGPLMVGWLTYLSGSQRVGMSTVVIFFTLGLLVLLPLKRDHQPQAAGS